jgi:hypothetical protein
MSRGELTGKFSKAGDLGLVGPGLLSGGADEMNGAVTATLALLAMAGLALAWAPGLRVSATGAVRASKAS